MVFDSSSSCGLLGKLRDLVSLIFELLKDTRKVLVSSKKHKRGRRGKGRCEEKIFERLSGKMKNQDKNKGKVKHCYSRIKRL
jgi:hypothetical protein